MSARSYSSSASLSDRSAAAALSAALSAALAAAAADLSLNDALDEYERALISRALAGAQGNVAEAARRLQTDRPSLYRRMKRLGIGGP